MTVVNAGLRETAVGASLVDMFTLKGVGFMLALNVVDMFAHWVVVALEKVKSIDNESKSALTVR